MIINIPEDIYQHHGIKIALQKNSHNIECSQRRCCMTTNKKAIHAENTAETHVNRSIEKIRSRNNRKRRRFS